MTSAEYEGLTDGQENSPSIELVCELGHYTIGLAWDGVEIDGVPTDEPLTELEQLALRFFIENPNLPRTRIEIGQVMREGARERISHNAVRGAIGHLANPDIVPLLHHNLVTFGNSSQTVVMLARDVTEAGKSEIAQALRALAETSGKPSYKEAADNFERTGKLRPVPIEKRPTINEPIGPPMSAARVSLDASRPLPESAPESPAGVASEEAAELEFQKQQERMANLTRAVIAAPAGTSFDYRELTDGKDLTEGQKVINFRILQKLLKSKHLKADRDDRGNIVYIRTEDKD